MHERNYIVDGWDMHYKAVDRSTFVETPPREGKGKKKTAVIDHIVARSSSKMVYAACKNKNGLCHVGANKVISIFLPYEN